MTTHNSSDCDYIHHENGIHEFVFKKSSRAAVDFLLKHTGEIRNALDEDDQISYFLHDFRPAGFPPFRYGVKETRRSRKNASNNNEVVQAFITNPGSMVEISKVFLNTLFPNGRMKFFGSDQRAEAIAWLTAKIEAEREQVVE